VTTFDFDAYASPRLPKAVEQERALVAHVRQRLSQRGHFTTRTGKLAFRTTRGQMIDVSMAPGGKFLKFVGRAVGLSPRMPMIRRAVEALVADVRDTHTRDQK